VGLVPTLFYCAHDGVSDGRGEITHLQAQISPVIAEAMRPMGYEFALNRLAYATSAPFFSSAPALAFFCAAILGDVSWAKLT